MKTFEASTMILILLLASSIASVSALANFSFGGKSGDWIEYNLQETFLAEEQSETLEFLNVTGTTVTLQVDINSLSMNETTVDLRSNDDFSMAPWFSARVYFIPGGLTTNDSVNLGLFGNRTIVGETTGSYAGADRRVVYANFTAQPGNYIFYWDKQTGVLVEGTETDGAEVTDVQVSDTNMWEGAAWWLWIILWIVIIIVIALGVLSSRKKLHENSGRKRDSQLTSTKVVLFPLLFQKERLIQMRGFI